MAYAKSKPVRLDDCLILNAYINNLFGMKSFDEFQRLLKNVEEGFDDEGRSHVFNTPRSQKDIDPQLRVKLEDYDSNIKSYVDHINARRETRVSLKYFQYLAVLFTEIFLDRYFENPTALMNDLTRASSEYIQKSKDKDYGFIYTLDDLRKLAFWMATGSGKTLLFHINYLQFMRYNKGDHRIEPDNILLITPNESLSSQHIAEMRMSRIPCELFQQQTGLFSQYADHNVVKVIDIHKLTEEKKGQGVTVDIENFGSRNLIFVDEGHKGSGGKKWKYFREQLVNEGFTFEYSATFGQAVAVANGNDAKDLLHEYGKSIIFDYSYRYFYNDGYGKEYSIMNLKDVKYSESTKHMLMLANLLTLYEQKLIFNKHAADIEPYNIEDPLWIFVGSKVQGKQNQSDILEVVRFLDLVLKNEGNWAVESIGKILTGNSGLKDKTTGWDLFSPTYPEQRLGYLRGSEPEDIYKDMFRRIFHSENPAPLHLINLKNAPGEIALRCGLSEFFGVINIGDDNQFIKLAENEKIQVFKDDVSSGSLFDTINRQNSKVNVLIGAKKFIEGWNSWRVSNMGLLNFGKSEGTQIIQLFGRGVRLKGKNNSLKRSKEIEDYPPENLYILERLNIFGIEANYMDQFEEYLKTEGMPTEHFADIAIPIEINRSFLQEGLLYPYVDKKLFKEEEFFELKFDEHIRPVEVNLMSKVEIIESQKQPGISTQSESKPKTIDHKFLDMLDWSRIYFSLLEFRIQKAWNNIIFPKEALREIVEKDVAAYSLKCLDDDIAPKKFEDLLRLEEIVVSILKKYLQNFHNRQRNIWTKKNLDVLQLDESNGNFEFKEFKVTASEKYPGLIEEIRNFKPPYEKGANISHVYFDRHLYQPLLVKDEGTSPLYKTIPDGLNEGERQFIEDLKRYIVEKQTEFSEHRKMFVLRNLPKKGIGFFVETLNYFPDFIVWIKTDEKQRIIFADPKGLTHINRGFEDEKIQLFSHIKDIEAILAKKLSDRGEKQKIELDSYIISVTSARDMQPFFHTSLPSTYKQHHILLQEEKGKYIAKMLVG